MEMCARPRRVRAAPFCFCVHVPVDGSCAHGEHWRRRYSSSSPYGEKSVCGGGSACCAAAVAWRAPISVVFAGAAELLSIQAVAWMDEQRPVFLPGVGPTVCAAAFSLEQLP